MKKIIEYNKKQSEKYGWEPSWFNCDDYNQKLIDSIKKFQTIHGLSVDGMCGPSTYRRIWTERESEIDSDYKNETKEGKKYIVHNANLIEINWDKVVLWNDKNGFESRKYKSQAGKVDREPNLFVTHWDVCLSSKSCHKVLSKRGLSVHFLIDNDGTIFQCLDTQHIAYHAGYKNKSSIGVEVSNAYSVKYQNWYRRNGFGSRPIWSGVKVHGKRLKPFTGFYDVQIQALAALWEAISRACGLPLEVPEEETVSKDVVNGSFSGFCCHYHITKKKIDCAGLDMEKVLEFAKQKKIED